MTEDIYLSDTEAPAFVFVDKAHQGKDGKGWRQSKDESAYEQPVHADAGDLPSQWTGEHVIQRLIEAFKTDRYCKMDRPKQPGYAHPQIEYSAEDREGWIADDRPIITGPSRVHFDRMEEAFGWLDAYTRIDPVRAWALKEYAKLKAFKRSLNAICRDAGVDRRTFRDRSEAAARDIALALAACRTPVS